MATGDGRFFEFSFSMAPYPMILANEPQNFWLGGQFSLTKGAQSFAENINYEQFYYGLRQLFFFDYFSPAIDDWIVDQ